jgi:hypothetical protein
MHSLEAHEIASGRTVVRHPDLCVPDNGRTAGGTRGRGHLGLVPHGDGAAAVWRCERRRGKKKKRKTHATETNEARTDSSQLGDHACVGRGLARVIADNAGLGEPKAMPRSMAH